MDSPCVCHGHHVEIFGQYTFSAAGGGEPCDSGHMHLHNNGSATGMVLSVPSLRNGTAIELAPGAVLSHPITIYRRTC
eukprot:364282-Chlamydomonas_euryale.AAC.40